MTDKGAFSFRKSERIHSLKQIDELFGGGKSRALSAFPIRVVYRYVHRLPTEAPFQVLISVPKRNLKHAVDRNRVKRQLREAYRLNKHLLFNSKQKDSDKGMDMAFIWLDSQLYDSEKVHHNIVNLLTRLAEKLWNKKPKTESTNS